MSITRATQSGSVFGQRMRQARILVGIPQDKLGVLIGLDEGSSSARMSRYENGVHEPPIQVAKRIAEELGVPLAFMYCDDDDLKRPGFRGGSNTGEWSHEEVPEVFA